MYNINLKNGKKLLNFKINRIQTNENTSTARYIIQLLNIMNNF